MPDLFGAIVAGSVLIEAVIEALKSIKNGGFQWQYYLSIVIGVVVTVVYGLDLFTAVGLNTDIPHIGSVLSGIILARGANVVSDLIAKLRG